MKHCDILEQLLQVCPKFLAWVWKNTAEAENVNSNPIYSLRLSISYMPVQCPEIELKSGVGVWGGSIYHIRGS
jgi:hypothetical protein